MSLEGRDLDSLRERARGVLARNDVGTFTRPSPHLYPHLWSWDSAFAAFGLRHHAPERALQEIQSTMEAQWDCGMVPHIRFHPDVDERAYFPGPSMWRVREFAKGTPAAFETSGILQPPVHAWAAAELHEQGVPIPKELFERLVAWHRYLMEHRDPWDTGGITILHPWESGLDNSPRWDGPLRRYPMEAPPEYTRVDTEHVGDHGDRPTDADYDRYVDLLIRLREVGYSALDLPEDYPFRVKDVLTTALFAAANRKLVRLADALGQPREKALLSGYQERVLTNFERLFAWPDAYQGLTWFVDFDMVTQEPIRVFSCAGAVVPLVGPLGMTTPGRWLRTFLKGPFRQEGGPYPALVPSTAPCEETYDPICYWRGPVWINIQWLLTQGLPQGSPVVREIRDQSLELLDDQDFYEYFDPRDGSGHGGTDFSWSAALALDWLAEA